jgi:hypothetical protein
MALDSAFDGADGGGARLSLARCPKFLGQSNLGQMAE